MTAGRIALPLDSKAMKPDTDLHRRLATALERVSTALRGDVNAAAREEGLSALQLRALQELVQRPDRRLGELARVLHVTPGTLSAAVTTLEEKGLALKAADPEEHRAVLLKPSRAGRALVKRARTWPDESLVPATDALGERETGEVLEGLLRLIQALEASGVLRETRMCLHCEHFQAWAGSGDRPHRCGLLESSIGGGELQVDCDDFAETTPAERDRRMDLLRRAD